MDLNTVIDISPGDRELLSSLLLQYLPHTAVWAHGSRITGNARPWSDLDLVVFINERQKSDLSRLKEALEESNLTFRVELLEWDCLPDNFKTNITNSHTVIA
jgi:predicted nucleotidyltransferase